MSIDSWTNASGVSTIGICVNEHLWSVTDTGAESHTGQNLAIEAMRAINDMETRAQYLVVGICSDAASNMEAMKGILTERRPDIKSWVCQAHCLQLLVSDLVKDKGRDKVLDSVSLVLNRFKNSNLGNYMREMGRKRPKLGCLTRWSSQRDMLLYFNQERAFLQQVLPVLLLPLSFCPLSGCRCPFKAK